MAAPSLFFFTGENEYLLSEELKRWKKEFAMKHGDENLLVLDAQKVRAPELIDAFASMPFIAEKRLVVVSGIPRFEKDDMNRVLDACHAATIVVFAELAPDKRLSSTKVLEARATVKKFPKFQPKTLDQWIAERARQSGLSITPKATVLLRERVGDDARMMAQEIEKLALAVGSRDIGEADVALLTPPSGERVVWGLTNLLGERKYKQALAFLWDHVDRGENPYGLWTILLDMTRKLISVWALARGGDSASAIASELKMHPFAIQGLLPLARSLTDEQARFLCGFVADADIALKTGGYKYTVETPDEVIALTERAILACA